MANVENYQSNSCMVRSYNFCISNNQVGKMLTKFIIKIMDKMCETVRKERNA